MERPTVLPGIYCLVLSYQRKYRKSIEQLLERRVRREVLISALEGLSRTEQFVRAAQKPQPLAKVPQELCLDYQFIRLFKQNEANYTKLIRGEIAAGSSNDNIIQSFKDLIKRQDEEISELKQNVKNLTAENESLQQQVDTNTTDQEMERLRAELERAEISGQQNESYQLQMQEMQRFASFLYQNISRVQSERTMEGRGGKVQAVDSAVAAVPSRPDPQLRADCRLPASTTSGQSGAAALCRLPGLRGPK